MKKVLVIGCPGAGKSTFSRKLSAKTHLPLYYLDMIWHRPDKTTIGRETFDLELARIMQEDEWIIDGTYLRTLSMRLECCDTVILFDIPVNICLEGALKRTGMPREDMPWTQSEMDSDFSKIILDFPKIQMPVINELLSSCEQKLNIIRFKSRAEADNFIATI